MIYEEICDKYRDRINAILNRIATLLRDNGFEVSTVFESIPNGFGMCIESGGTIDEHVDIDFRICESEEYDGSKNGVNFSIDIVGESGMTYGEVIPFNFTDRVWVDINDEDAVDERFRFIENIDISNVVSLLNE